MTARGPSPDDRTPSTSASLLRPPASGAVASFTEDFGQRVLLTVDTEEEFDWNGSFQRSGYGLEHVSELARFQSFCEEIGAHPVYLVDWPITEAPKAVEIIGDAVARGKAELGMQLHPWVNPPFDEELSAHNSFPGNLSPELEAAKFHALLEQIETTFGTRPVMYRAGRYGVGPNTANLLSEAKISLDTSIRALFDYSAQGGPDFSGHPPVPYWTSEDRSVLELPITSTYWGILRQQGPALHRLQRHVPTFFAGFSRFKLLERIALTPEGVTIEEAIRGVDIALDDGLPLLVLSFHSPSLAPGFTPYAPDQAGVEAIYAWLRAVYAYLGQRGVQNARAAQVIEATRKNR
ncbi:MAG: WalW protein [Erythrobacter sp.]|nr:WalW protein [Erythrobacter sp.]